MGFFSKSGPVDKQYEYDQGIVAAEKNDKDDLLKHSVRLLTDDRSNPDGWILKAALQLHGKDFDIEMAAKTQISLISKAIATSSCHDTLNDAFSSYKRAIGYCKDESKLYDYLYIFGYSMAYDLA